MSAQRPLWPWGVVCAVGQGAGGRGRPGFAGKPHSSTKLKVELQETMKISGYFDPQAISLLNCSLHFLFIASEESKGPNL